MKEQTFTKEERRDVHMSNEDYRKLIIQLANEKRGLEWLKAVYSFAVNYPDKEDKKKE